MYVLIILHVAYIVKQVDFVGNLLSQILRKGQIREIKLQQNFEFYIDIIGKFSILMK